MVMLSHRLRQLRKCLCEMAVVISICECMCTCTINRDALSISTPHIRKCVVFFSFAFLFLYAVSAGNSQKSFVQCFFFVECLSRYNIQCVVVSLKKKNGRAHSKNVRLMEINGSISFVYDCFFLCLFIHAYIHIPNFDLFSMQHQYHNCVGDTIHIHCLIIIQRIKATHKTMIFSIDSLLTEIRSNKTLIKSQPAIYYRTRNSLLEPNE